ncbi:hypothetical protein [Streptomyces sp. NPDC097619]|uniref:hypothetical protein n=1 Tax=Streptomyces sp. NPDC097619 TaxID=3157228 RepID=UPI00331C05F9
MAEVFPVRCPSCGRHNAYAPPAFPCSCGSPVALPLDVTAPPQPLSRRSWSDGWVTARCAACGRRGEWPVPEVGCSCGTVARIPVLPAEPRSGSGTGASGAGTARAGEGSAYGCPVGRADRLTWSDGVDGHGGGGEAGGAVGGDGGNGSGHGNGSGATTGAERGAFRPVTIRTAWDAAATAARYLRWLGFPDVRLPGARPAPTGPVDLRAPGLVAMVDPTTAPADLRAVECLWLTGLTLSLNSVYFALAGYTEEARGGAAELGMPLFVMDLTGVPQPVNGPADGLVASGA